MLFLIAGGLAVVLLNKNSTEVIVPARKIALGAWTEGLFDAHTQTLHPDKLLDFEQMIDKKVSIAHFYRGWEALIDPNLMVELDILRANKWEPMLNVNPYYFSECPASQVPLYRAIADGQCDEFLHKAGKNLSSAKEPFYLLFAWEMNNYPNEWSISHTGSTASDFVAAWRHVHTIFKEENATGVRWVFCPNIPDVEEFPYNDIYPGDAYVDWIALDGYNWGTTQSWSQWNSFAGVFTAPYNKITSIAPSKPLMIAEVNTTDRGGNKASWYKDMFVNQIPHNFPKVQAVILFNEDRSKQENVNWKIDVSKEALEEFSSSINTKNY